MATGASSILREYFVSLGYKVNGTEQKKFEKNLVNLDKLAVGLGKSLLGVAAATQAMVAMFANQMEKLYYNSRLANATAGNLKAMAFGAEQVGVSGTAMTKAIIAMNQAIRATGGANGGMAGFLQSLGIKTTGRKTDDIFLDFLDAAAKYSPEVQNAWAQMFGIDPQTMQLLVEGRSQLRKAADDQRKMALAAGVDMDQATAAGLRYAQMLRVIVTQLGLLKDVTAVTLLPSFEILGQMFSDFLDKLTKVVSKIKTLADFKNAMVRGAGRAWDETVAAVTGVATEKGGVVDSLTTPLVKGYEDFMRWGGAKRYRSAGAGSGRGFVNPARVEGDGTASGGERVMDLFSRLENQYGLPDGFLDRMWKKESGRGKNMLSRKGAQGDFQFMPDTAKEWGVDVTDLTSSATGAARYMAWLKKRYGGDLSSATAAYNWGLGNVDQYGLGRAPRETRDYVDAVAGPSIRQETNITVHGAGSPRETADAIRQEQSEVNASMLRNLKPRVQ